ncbi:hypothetical protein [Mycolicibacterium goodii]|uniref:hypothetical protein n=1 Tax=Mycolicibacterium goodii TaxID=134601 RepID=UPI0012FF770E
MSSLSYKHIVALCLSAAVMIALTACTAPSSDITAVDASTHIPVSATLRGVDCKDPEFSRQQFVGSWGEPDSATVITLKADGSLEELNSRVESGRWSFTAWEASPAGAQESESMAGICVLWLSLNYEGGAPLDLVYRPIAVTDRAITLSYIGRGNSIQWIRKDDSG